MFLETMTAFESAVAGSLVGGTVLALIAGFLFLALLIGIAVYVYSSWALMTIGKKLKYKKSWLAWIPIANIAMVLQLGGFHWAWVFLVLTIIGIIPLYVLAIISLWRIFEKRKYPGWLALAPLIDFVPGVNGIGFIASLVILGIVAWRK